MREWLLPPNLLTFARIAVTPYIGWSIARGEVRSAFPIIIAAGFSDALDGYLARRFNWGSALGEKLDPIADKFILAVAYVALWRAGIFPGWLTALVIGRDIAILVFAALALALTDIRRLPPSLWGKLSTIFQMSLAGFAILGAAFPDSTLGHPALWFFTPVLMPVTAFATIWSGLHYAWTGLRQLRGQG